MFAILRRLLVRVTPPALRPHLARWYRGTRFRLNTHVGRCPALFFALHRRDPTYRDRLAGPDREIVIEGAPRVALTYTVDAFSLAQARKVAIATHTHLPANVLRATVLGVPVLVVIRDPEPALRSALLRNRDLTTAAVLERYLHFHRPLLQVADRIVIADFDEVTSDLGSVIERVNRRFGTSFRTCSHDAGVEQRVTRELEQRDRLLGLDALGSYLPNATKRQAADTLRIDTGSSRFRACRDVYRRLRQYCGGSP